MANDERLRLLFVERVDDVEHKRSEKINQGAATLLAQWPSYIASVIWGVVFILSLVTLLMLLIFMILVRQEKVVERNIFIPSKEGLVSKYFMTQEIRSEFCQQMISKSHEKRQDIPEKDLEIFDSGNNVFYVLTEPLLRNSSCSVESVLKICYDKNIFLLILKKNAYHHYEHILGNSYPNLNMANIDGNKLLRGSPFEGQWKGDERSLFKAALLTVWQFGGTVISNNLLMMNKNIYNENQRDCVVDIEVIFCPHQCAAFIYYLIGETLKSKENVSTEALIDSSIVSFCGSEHFRYTGCPGVIRLEDIISSPEPKSIYVRFQDWGRTASWEEIARYCPVTYKINNILDRESATSSSSMTSIVKEKRTIYKKNTVTKKQTILLEAATTSPNFKILTTNLL